MKIETYRWTPGSKMPAWLKPHEAARELDRIRRGAKSLTAPAVVDAARPKTALLHGCFEWDDRKAARLQREATARLIIRSVEVVVEGGDEAQERTVRAYHFDESDYRRTSDIMAEKDSRERLLSRARDEMLSWRRRYSDLQEFSKVFEAVDEIAA